MNQRITKAKIRPKHPFQSILSQMCSADLGETGYRRIMKGLGKIPNIYFLFRFEFEIVTFIFLFYNNSFLSLSHKGISKVPQKLSAKLH